MERAWTAYQDYLERAFEDVPSLMKKFTVDITCDLADRGDKFVLTADLPGMEKDEVNINLTDNEVEISAEHRESKEEKKKDYIRQERSQVRYERTLSVPEEIVGSKVTATMQNGILTVELPKKATTKIESPISVKVG
jgi:HSP20 family protein